MTPSPRVTPLGPPSSSIRARRGAATPIIIVVVAVVAVAGGFWFLRSGPETDGSVASDVFEAQRGSFDITIPASGELAALRQIEIASRLDDRATITEIVAEGAQVKKGDVLIRLSDEAIRERIKDAADDVNTAETAWVTAKSNLDIRRQSHESELDKADLDIKLAQLALKAWEEGDDIAQRTKLDLEVRTAQKDYDRLVERFEASKDLLAQEFISRDEFQRDEIQMIQASSRLEQAKLAVTVYANYEYEQSRAKFISDHEQAVDERSRMEQRHLNEIKSQESDVESKEYQRASRKERLEKYQGQLVQCTIVAPQDGLVVYAASTQQGRHGRSEGQPPTVGDELRRNETVIILPDTSKMVAEVKVNEALSGKIEAGQRATVFSDALPDTLLEGEVLSVGVLAESGGWRDPNRRDYTVRISLLDGADLGLKPSMRCKASIAVGRVDEALFVPVQALFHDGGQPFVYVPDGSGYAQHAVVRGRSSELYVEIIGGLEPGQPVLLRAPATEQVTKKLDGSAETVASSGGRPEAGSEAPSQVRPASFQPGSGAGSGGEGHGPGHGEGRRAAGGGPGGKPGSKRGEDGGQASGSAGEGRAAKRQGSDGS